MDDNYGAHITRVLASRGRKVTGWWDGEPIHRPMTDWERAESMGLDPKTAAFALSKLKDKDYKPSY